MLAASNSIYVDVNAFESCIHNTSETNLEIVKEGKGTLHVDHGGNRMSKIINVGCGRATKQDGRLERVLRAAVIPEGRRGREDSRTTHRVRSPSTPTTVATRNHARGLRRSGTQGRKLATRPRPIRPGKRGGVASSEDRGRRARSGKEPTEQAAGTAGAVTTRIHLPTTLTNIRGPSTPHRETGRCNKGVRPLRQPGEEPGQ
ncbi:hypothetical protein NDU88_007837 [Pleurodeles waltl]|uniref:Uncharacterized protein n=1 Tax=Pleurodeles waltl TaxID=8319 RepID=A0AAV7N4L1_PLEWA|nr:hypothetical protein NDU88_007837 [Pleurodeles waltl]